MSIASYLVSICTRRVERKTNKSSIAVPLKQKYRSVWRSLSDACVCHWNRSTWQKRVQALISYTSVVSV